MNTTDHTRMQTSLLLFCFCTLRVAGTVMGCGDPLRMLAAEIERDDRGEITHLALRGTYTRHIGLAADLSRGFNPYQSLTSFTRILAVREAPAQFLQEP